MKEVSEFETYRHANYNSYVINVYTR